MIKFAATALRHLDALTVLCISLSCLVIIRKHKAGENAYYGYLLDSEEAHDEDSTGNISKGNKPEETRPSQLKQPRVAKLSFESYHADWKLAATALPPEPLLPQRNGACRQPQACTRVRLDGVTPASRLTQRQFRDLVEAERNLWYGRFNMDKMARPAPNVKLVESQFNRVSNTNSPQPQNTIVLQPPPAKGGHPDAADYIANPTVSGSSSTGNCPSLSKSDSDWERDAMTLEEWASNLV
ncbi:hypothetical protein HDU83_007175 [Entophlyctis luteolus]|nr:hypothetical protein HDU83_007175 [Entophlyctis luteolus]KAJ3378762.1 hypothetical protein HDU84_007321 [Entophlyctis sp. JEL0112]